MKHFYERIGYDGELSGISKIICEDYGLGDFESNELIEVGYEDFNFVLKTNRAKYFVKIFAKNRSDSECVRYVDIMSTLNSNGVSSPKIFESVQGFFHKIKCGGVLLRLVVVEYIDGKNLYELSEELSESEIRQLAKIVSKINRFDVKPPFVYDSWAISNILKEYYEGGKYLEKEDLRVIGPLVKSFRELDIDSLPHCFVHGDVIVTNVIRDENGKLWIVDFSVSNYYPRIQELAVLACNILFDENSQENSDVKLKIFLGEYQKYIRLTEKEIEVLPIYIKFAHAMHVIRANYEKVVKGDDSEENEYWLNLGRKGLGIKN